MPKVVHLNKAEVGQAHSSQHRLLRVLSVFIVINLIIVNAYSWLMTSNGLLLSAFVPPNNTFLSSNTMTHMVTAVLQVCIVGFYLTLPRTHYHLRFSIPILSFGILVILASAFLSLVSISNHALGTHLLDNRRSDIRMIGHDLQIADNHISQSFQSKLSSFERLAQRARKGLDQTGIAKCGNNCKGYLREVNQIHRDYSVLAIPAYSQPITIDDWSAVQQAYAQLQPRLKQYQQFAKQYKIPLPATLTQLHHRMQTTRTSITDIGNNPFHLSIEWLTTMLSNYTDPRFCLAVFLAFLPDTLSIILTCLLSFSRHYDTERIDIQRHIKRNQSLTALYQQKQQAAETAHRSKLKDTYAESLWNTVSKHS